jgi:hypothetical protein
MRAPAFTKFDPRAFLGNEAPGVMAAKPANTVGQSCAVNGKSGTLQYVAGSSGLTCIPDDEADDWADGLSDKQIAHEEYRRDLETTWRNPTADVLVSDHLPVRRTGVDTRDASTVARDHQETMSQLYAQLDAELSEKWRNHEQQQHRKARFGDARFYRRSGVGGHRGTYFRGLGGDHPGRGRCRGRA